MKPILFNTEMVRAILDGRKSVTRRVIKPQPICHGPNNRSLPHEDDFISHHWEPPYQTGDLLYVRETWAFDTGDDDEEGTGYFAYKSDGAESPTGHWHPSIHMPKAAARLFLWVTGVRVERLRDITEEQAEKEGCTAHGGNLALDEFEAVWDSTIKKADLPLYGWDANPWVWVIEFERCEKPKEESKC